MSDQLHEGDNCPNCETGIMKKIPLGKDFLEQSGETQDYQRLQCDKCGYIQGYRNISIG